MVYFFQGDQKNEDEALSWLKKAQASYGALGDESQVKVLAQRIDKIQK
jgi:hypothetical protein